MAVYSYVDKFTLTKVTTTTGIYTSSTKLVPGALVGKTIKTTGFVTSANNATSIVTANTDRTITTNNSSSSAETHAGVATVKTVAITSTTAMSDVDTANMRTQLGLLDSLLPTVAYGSGILTLTMGDGRVLKLMASSTDVSKMVIKSGALAGTSYVLSAAGNANGVYTGTIGASANTLKGSIAVIAGFTTGANNGAFMVTANNGSTTITTTNTSSATESHAGTASFDSIVADNWTVADMKRALNFAQAAIALISAYTATVFTVTY